VTSSRSERRRWISRHRAGWLLALLAVTGSRAVAQQPTPEEIQRQREAAERKRVEYLDEKARVDHINERVALYKQLQASIPFEPVPNTSNMVQVFMSGHDLRDVAYKIYSVADQATDAGFSARYWPMVLFLNRAKDYDGGLPRYGKLDPQTPELNVALFPNVRKQGFAAIVAPIENADSIAALDMTKPVVLAYRQRLADEVAMLAAQGGDVQTKPLPASLPSENRLANFRGVTAASHAKYPARKSAYPTQYVNGDSVPVDLQANLEPAPVAMALRQGVNMLGSQYQGYNLEYKPSRLDLTPEVGAMAFLGARTPTGEPVTEPGTYLGFNQRFFGFLLANESAFVTFSASDAPAVNGGSLSAGLDINFHFVNLAAMAGLMGLRVVGETDGGPTYAGRIRVQFTDHVFGSVVYRYSGIEHFQVVDENGVGRSGVTNASYFGIGVALR